ncbi:Dps family protein [Cupriavidus malaysiensis]|uniref:DNA starvation/stationary phase protection protein n=1 Tax=Cupriavidus malaysiensis TaxID=367825 RepID=A0ABM6FF96_9BURK|nr:DNA starvation/stationary phase protection protein [Cupriavidus malaysiensis]AOZ10589.1 DNA starvation/stationary phase protection protein [Cupriavidus malaysiensis]
MTPTPTLAPRHALFATTLPRDAAEGVFARLNPLLADVFTLYMKTKNFHWHMSGPHFRDYHLLLDEQAAQVFAMTDDIAERVRKLGGATLHSIGDITRLQRLRDSEQHGLAAGDMLLELHADNQLLAASMQEAHAVCEKLGDVATASMLEVWIDEAQRRAWFLREACR